ncbi:hypothetical protein ACFQ2T_13530 [Methylophilus flavus]|uniref:Uncharacterized protein n=1 Tax=Methylophilus flavus TaxID=640084 RepID=A0ABW3PGQ1_9PROT
MRVSKHFLFVLLLTCQSCLAESLEQGPARLVETDDSLCLAHGGKLVSVQLTDAATILQEGPVEVWVDRWFMQVQTADHTRHILTAEEPEKELGCSHSLAGPQHWTLSTIKRLPVAGAPFRKESP